MGTLPMDIILWCILPKLHAKSLLRFKCVSKSFLAEISSPQFVKLHHHNTLSSNSNRLLIVPFNYEQIHIYDLDFLDAQPLICRYPKPVTFWGCMCVMASCECYLLLATGYTNPENLILFNPTTRTYRELPIITVSNYSSTPIYGVCHCVDEFYDDYKVIRICEFELKECIREIMVYSLKTNKWKLIESKPRVSSDEDILSRIHSNGVVVQNHLLHWVFVDEYCGNERLSRVGCFDMKAEQWSNDVPLPDIHPDDNAPTFSTGLLFGLSVLDGKLCFSARDANASMYNLWVMKDYGVKESWVKLMSLPYPDEPERGWHWQEAYRPIAYRENSPNELLCERPRSRDHPATFFWYNLRNKEAIEADIYNLPTTHWKFSTYTCKGSLLNFPGAQFITSVLSYDEEEDDNDEEEDHEDNWDIIA